MNVKLKKDFKRTEKGKGQKDHNSKPLKGIGC